MNSDENGADHEGLRKAMTYLEQALALLDAEEAPDDIGAHIDRAICRLKEKIQERPSDSLATSAENGTS